MVDRIEYLGNGTRGFKRSHQGAGENRDGVKVHRRNRSLARTDVPTGSEDVCTRVGLAICPSKLLLWWVTGSPLREEHKRLAQAGMGGDLVPLDIPLFRWLTCGACRRSSHLGGKVVEEASRRPN
jgi:hypothetical protein